MEYLCVKFGNPSCKVFLGYRSCAKTDTQKNGSETYLTLATDVGVGSEQTYDDDDVDMMLMMATW